MCDGQMRTIQHLWQNKLRKYRSGGIIFLLQTDKEHKNIIDNRYEVARNTNWGH